MFLPAVKNYWMIAMHFGEVESIKHRLRDLFSQPAPERSSLEFGYESRYFKEMVDFVFRIYPSFFTDEQKNLLMAFCRSSVAAQTLYLKLWQRKSEYFWWNKLKYPFVEGWDDPSIESLKSTHLLEGCSFLDPNHPFPISEALSLCTKPELLQNLRWIPEDLLPQKVSLFAKLPKCSLVLALNLLEIPALMRLMEILIEKNGPLIYLNQTSIFDKIQFLFFGSKHQELSEFVIRDVGNRKFETYQIHGQTRYFKSEAEFEAKWFRSQLQDHWESFWNDSGEKRDFDLLCDLMIQTEKLSSLPTQVSTEKIWKFLAERFYQQKRFPLALECLHKIESNVQSLGSFAHRELMVKCYLNQQKLDRALELCLFSKGPSETAWPFVEWEEFRLKKIQKTVKWISIHRKDWSDLALQTLETHGEIYLTQSKKSSRSWPVRSIKVDFSGATSVEEVAVKYLKDMGYEGAKHLENTLWSSLYGVVFWEAIFHPCEGAFIHPFQGGPLDAFSSAFYLSRKEIIDKILEEMVQKSDFFRKIEAVFREKWGYFNHFVSFNESVLEALLVLVELAPLESIKKVLKMALCQPKRVGKGHPDIFAHGQGKVEFWEVKSPQDALRPHQKVWLNTLQELGFKAGVLCLEAP